MHIHTPDNIIEVPGRGFINLEAEAVNRAVMEEDNRLRFGWNEVNQDWMVYILMPREFDAYYRINGEPVYPVVGFQNTIPEPHEAVERLRKADGRRHGMRILNDLNKYNDDVRREAQDTGDAAIDETAERVEHTLRKDGYMEKYSKVYMN